MEFLSLMSAIVTTIDAAFKKVEGYSPAICRGERMRLLNVDGAPVATDPDPNIHEYMHLEKFEAYGYRYTRRPER